MKFDIKNAMDAALRLTQSGRVIDATAKIQKALSGKRANPVELHQRASLGETVNTLHTMRQRAQEPRSDNIGTSPAPLKVPDGAQFLTQRFSCHAGTREYKLYLPAHTPQGRRPLLVMLHGCTQDADDFAAGTRMNTLAENLGMLVAYPVQTKGANPSACWNWFNPAEAATLSGVKGQRTLAFTCLSGKAVRHASPSIGWIDSAPGKS